jgi:Hemerythrin HHE cation binding domain
MEPLLRSFGQQLIDIHNSLRQDLAHLRAYADSYRIDGGDRPRELRTHCLAFCTAVRRHHIGEDGGAFRVLDRRFPDLSPVIEELGRDHEIVAGILRQFEALVAEGATGPDPAEAQRIRFELDGLAALLESHFVFEEKKLVTALDALDIGSATAEHLFGASVRES